MKKIFFLSDNFPPERNAAASRVFERGVYWVKEGHSLTVLTSFPNFPEGKVYEGYKNSWHKEETLSGIRTIRVKTFIAPNKNFFLRVVDFFSYMISSFVAGLFLIKDHDVIIATSPQLLTAVSAWALSKVKGKPFIFELGDLWPESISALGAMKKSLVLQYLERLELFLYRESKAVVALTEAFKTNLVRRGIDPQKIYVVRNGVDLSRHQPKSVNQALKSSLGLDGKFIIGYIGTHGMAHDLERVLQVAKILQEQKKNQVAFLFVGAGASKEYLKKIVSDQKLANVVFVDAQPKEKIGEYWDLTDIALVHLKQTEIFTTVIPSKMFEAMAYGKPILLIAPEGEAIDIIRESETGICLSDYDIATFAATVDQLSQDTALCAQLSKKCLASAREFTRQVQASKFMQVIYQITEPTSSEPRS